MQRTSGYAFRLAIAAYEVAGEVVAEDDVADAGRKDEAEAIFFEVLGFDHPRDVERQAWKRAGLCFKKVEYGYLPQGVASGSGGSRLR